MERRRQNQSLKLTLTRVLVTMAALIDPFGSRDGVALVGVRTREVETYFEGGEHTTSTQGGDLRDNTR